MSLIPRPLTGMSVLDAGCGSGAQCAWLLGEGVDVTLMPPWDVTLASFARILRPGSWAVISLDHPFGAPLPDQRGGYFRRELVSDAWTKADV